MLTADLVRVDFHRGEVRPRYIRADDPDLLALAEALLGIFRDHAGRPYHELDSELEEFLGTGTAFLLHRGLAKLLLDRCEFATDAAVEPEQLRRAVFEEAAAAYRKSGQEAFDRAGILLPLEARFGLAADSLEGALYADLKSEQVLKVFEPSTPEWLLHRYNTALAQAVLLRASAVKIRMTGQTPSHYRALFRKLKFFQLLHRIERTADGGYLIHIDGPLSLFKSSQRYGLQMAGFLPTLLHLDQWTLEASLLWGKRHRAMSFRLSPDDGLLPHGSLQAQWQPGEMSWLPDQFGKLESGWQISAEAGILDLGGQGVLAPDYVFRHVDTGVQVFLEIFGFWRRAALEPRIELLKKHGPRNLILGVAKELYADEMNLANVPAEVYVFRSTPVAREVLALLEKFLQEA